ncbi:MAG: serine hydrolase [Chloracidobacterium sp.]|nr:serine hydrolase [Chloracidobacterium sp.]
MLVDGLFAKGHRRRQISIDGRVSVYLKEFDTEGKRTITISDLLTPSLSFARMETILFLANDPSEIISQR